MRRTYSHEIAQERFTSLYRDLERRAKDDRVEVRSRGQPGRIDESTLVARLRHLEGLRLAERLSPTSWRLSAAGSTICASSAHAATSSSTFTRLSPATPPDTASFARDRP